MPLLVAAAVERLQKEELLHEEMAATKIQAMQRGNSDRAAVRKQIKQEADAAVHIQAVYRGNTDRKRVAKAKPGVTPSRGKDLIAKLCRLLQGALQDGKLETALADTSGTAQAAPTEDLSADMQSQITSEKDQPVAVLQQRLSFEVTQAAWRAGAGVCVKDLLADFQEDILGAGQPAEISFGEGGFFISAGGGGLDAVLDEDEDAAFKAIADTDDDDLTEATRRMYLRAPPEGDVVCLDGGSQAAETFPPSANEAIQADPEKQQLPKVVADAKIGEINISVPAADIAVEEAELGVHPVSGDRAPEDDHDQALRNLCIHLLAKEAVMKTVLRSISNAEVRQAHAQASSSKEEQADSASLEEHPRPTSSLAAGAFNGSSGGQGASSRSVSSRNPRQKKMRPPATPGQQQQSSQETCVQKQVAGTTHRIAPLQSSRGRSRQPEQVKPDGSSRASSLAHETSTSASRHASRAPSTPRRPAAPKPTTKPSPRSRLQSPKTKSSTEAEITSSGASRPPSQTASGGLASRKELEKPHEKEDPEVTDPYEQEKDTTSMLPRAEEIPWAHQEHAEEVETDDGIFNCEVTDAEFQLLVDAGVLQESYGFMLAPVDDQFEHLSFPPGGSMVHPSLSSELQMQHPAPNCHGFGGSYGFTASEPQVQEYGWQGPQRSDNTLPGAADRQPTPPQVQAAQSMQQKHATTRQGGTSSAALRGAEAWGARQSESPEAGGDAHSEGEPLGEKRQAANSGKATKKAISSTSWQKKTSGSR